MRTELYISQNILCNLFKKIYIWQNYESNKLACPFMGIRSSAITESFHGQFRCNLAWDIRSYNIIQMIIEVCCSTLIKLQQVSRGSAPTLFVI